jgi:hypothetical protein
MFANMFVERCPGMVEQIFRTVKLIRQCQELALRANTNAIGQPMAGGVNSCTSMIVRSL